MMDSQQTAYLQSVATSDQSTRCLMSAFSIFGIPRSLLDVGCGDGHLPVLAARLGAYAWGVDLMLTPQEQRRTLDAECHCLRTRCHLFSADLQRPLTFGDPFDMVLCLEVAEHLPEPAARPLCDTLYRATRPGGVLLFSAAVPGQGGSGHLNEQPHSYWEDRLVAAGYQIDPPYTSVIRTAWSHVAPGAWWYGQNVQVLRRGNP